MVKRKTSGGYKWVWEKLPGHQRNEALDCRNYALAGIKILDPDFDALERRLKELNKKIITEQKAEKPAKTPRRPRRSKNKLFEDW